MKPSNEDLLLSKNNAKTLLFRNAVDSATLKKEEKMIQKERNFEEKIFLKQREQLMQRQSDLAVQLSPKSRRKEMLSASKLVLPEQSSPPRTRVTLSSGKPFSDAKHASASSHLTRDAPVPSSKTSLPEQSSPPRTRVAVSSGKTFSHGNHLSASNYLMQKDAHLSSSPMPEHLSPPRTRAFTSYGKTFSDGNLLSVSNHLLRDAPVSNSTNSLPDQLSPPRSRVTISRSKTFSASDRRSVTPTGKPATVSPTHSTVSLSDQQPSGTRSRGKMPAELKSRLSDNVLSVSLPDINVAGTKTLKKSSEIKLWKEELSQAGQNVDNEEASVIKDRENLRERRYLRTNSAEN